MSEYLLDANVLVALTHTQHVRHAAAHAWLAGLGDTDTWSTCPMTEAAFIRLLMNPFVIGDGMGLSAATAIAHLQAMKAWAGARHVFAPDDTTLADPAIDPSLLARSLVGHSQVTDFHLLNLAASRGARLATLDRQLAAGLPAPLTTTLHVIDTVPEE